MNHMKEIDHLALDGHALELFLAVLEEGSVTAAATRLGLTQSAVSHGLNKLRRIAGDPLFAKSGRGIVATAHAQALATKARALIDEMRSFAGGVSFAPAQAQLSLTIAANDFQRDLLLPRFFDHVAAQVRSLNLRVIPSQSPSPAMLRENRCDLLITPLPPSGVDIVQKRLLRDHYVCYYDAKARSAPASRSAYLAARHVTVVYTDNERLDFDRRLAANGLHRDIAISVPSFSGVPSFLRGSQMLASMPSLLAAGVMRGFAQAPIPLASRTRTLAELPMFMVWHQRYQKDPAHRWIRSQLEAVAATAAKP
ncbi:MAG: LysR family transcriptional regulator [Bradyrhizobium sp.]|uniref:LysR family transcriptional regulator n=1 Tax=Bradyrhizobium TaxID=374 RepID=UPI0003F779F4|nr:MULTISPECIES: LysR family transcriptional regulator [Bradyrhizobium]KQT23566.1 transcriptional regulator [Bradyrhizobium sp. Leaf396]